jgi:signal transduction histidine kinase/ActR/RegA family two-component response regulator
MAGTRQEASSDPATDGAAAADPRAPGETRALLRIVAAQAENSNPLVAVAALVMIFTMYGRVDTLGLLVWATLAFFMGVTRHLMSRRILARIDTATDAQMERDFRVTVKASAGNSIVMGLAFWLIAAGADMYIRMIVTLVSLVHMAAVMLYLMPGVGYRLVCSAGNVLQGALFWLGVANADGPHWEILVVYCGMYWCGMVAGREQFRQFRESLRVRDENAALLARLESERAAVQVALEEARLANKSKNRFLAAASHDLRQPLHALTMFLGTLGFHIGGDEGRRLLGRANETLRVLDEQFNSLLDLSRFDAGAVTASPRAFRLDELLHKLGEEFRPQAEAKGLQLTVQVAPALAWSDPLLLGRLLRNLLDNAVHYTSQGGVVLAMQPEAENLKVLVRDTGPGIPVEQQSSVFDEYVQLANPARQRERGVGLGLAIVKRIDQLLGLKLSLASRAGEGSTFAIQVPQAASESVEVLAPAAADPLAFRLHAEVWILDDDPVVLEGLEAQLRAWGAAVSTFRDPQAALSALRDAACPPAWLLTDDMLGETLSGLELAGQVHLAHPGVRVALITGNTEPARLAQLRASGHPVIIKPATPERLAALLAGPGAAPAAAPAA